MCPSVSGHSSLHWSLRPAGHTRRGRLPLAAGAGHAVRRAPVRCPFVARRAPTRGAPSAARPSVRPSVLPFSRRGPTRARRRTPTWARRATRPSSVRPFARSFVRSFARSPVRPFCACGRTRAVSVGREQQERQEAAQSRVRSVGGTPVELEAVGRGRKSPPGAPRSHGAHRGGAAGWERLRDGIAWGVGSRERHAVGLTTRSWATVPAAVSAAVPRAALRGAATRWPWFGPRCAARTSAGAPPVESVFDIGGGTGTS